LISFVVTENGRPVQHVLDNLRLPGGQLAHELDGAVLYRRLLPLGVADINVNMGLTDLLVSYSRHLKARAAAADADLRRLRDEPKAAVS
jgi:hypothetical protein